MASKLSDEDINELTGAVATTQLKQMSEGLLKVFIGLPPAERVELFRDIKYNDVFCVECGWGDRSSPNPNCQCNNDE